MTPYQQFAAYVGELNDLLCTINLLNWDANSNMPPGGAATRGQQIGTLVKLVQERFVSERMETLLEAAETAVSSLHHTTLAARNVAAVRHALNIAQLMPAELLAKLAETRSVAEQAWQAAKANNNFAQFAPYLEQFVALNRELTATIGYGDGHPYDAMLLRYEPGMRVAQLRPLLNELKAGLLPLLQQIVASSVAMPTHILQRSYPVAQQKAFCATLATQLGYDLTRGHFGEAPHPFEISFTRQDVRITNRYQRDNLAGGLFGMLHETGHALYEQGVAPELTRTALATDFLSQYAVGGTSFGVHESQSRLWENQIGRSRTFWQLHFPALQAQFPQQLADVEAEMFYRAINHVAPSYIRVEADEVTYNFHIMLRVELEMGLLDGSLRVRDLPDVWRERMEAYLGIVPPTDTVGVLQDIHWAFGQMGTFPAYTIGNLMSAQIFRAAQLALPTLAEQLERGEYQPLLAWLTDNVYQYGRVYEPNALLQRVCGEGLQTAVYLTYLTEKYSELYEL